jgi:diguanylate cyclase (GGDEF)-like protein
VTIVSSARPARRVQHTRAPEKGSICATAFLYTRIGDPNDSMRPSEAQIPEETTRLVRIARALVDMPLAILTEIDGDRLNILYKVGVTEGSVILPAARRLMMEKARATTQLVRASMPPEAGLFTPATRLGAIIAIPIHDAGVQRGLLVIADQVSRGDLDKKLPALEDVAALLAPLLARPFPGAAGLPGDGDRRRSPLEARAGRTRDSVTGLPLRSIAIAECERMLERAGVLQLRIAVMVVSLDRFRRINESLGPMAGDILLRQVAERLRNSVGEGDFVARRSGDEFIIVVEDLPANGSPLPVADRIQQALREQFHIQGHELSLTASVGIALFPDDANDATQLLRFADIALTRAKTQGTGRLTVFDRAMHEEVRDRVELEKDLRVALREGQLSLHYQSKYRIKGGKKHVGAEALLRWAHPTRGNISPARFIPVAEETGLIVPIGTWALTEVCRQQRKWADRRLGAGRVSVNVSSLQFARPDFVGTVTRAIRGAGIDPAIIELELTESIVMNDVDHVAARLGELRKFGLRVSVDDFGTGYSSLAYLSKLPLDVLKIDRSFVRELDAEGTRGTQAGAVAQAITSLGHSLGLDVLAEGVETNGQLERLSELGCDEVQGFLFAKPVPVAEIEAKLAASAA